MLYSFYPIALEPSSTYVATLDLTHFCRTVDLSSLALNQSTKERYEFESVPSRDECMCCGGRERGTGRLRIWRCSGSFCSNRNADNSDNGNPDDTDNRYTVDPIDRNAVHSLDRSASARSGDIGQCVWSSTSAERRKCVVVRRGELWLRNGSSLTAERLGRSRDGCKWWVQYCGCV
jgi:hypothetical protein